MPSLDFNQRAAIAASVQELSTDLDIPVYIEGDIFQGQDYGDMDPGEAARIVVDVVLDHTYVTAMIDERDHLWDALKWAVDRLATGIEMPPTHLLPVINAAVDAMLMEKDL